MEIRLSKYNAPFSEPSSDLVHYISLDDQRLMARGMYCAHVDCYLQNVPSTFEAFDSIHGVKYVFESAKIPFSQIDSHKIIEAVLSIADREFLDDLFLKSGIKAAGKRAHRCF